MWRMTRSPSAVLIRMSRWRTTWEEGGAAPLALINQTPTILLLKAVYVYVYCVVSSKLVIEKLKFVDVTKFQDGFYIFRH